MNGKLQAVIDKVLESIKSGDFPQAAARATFSESPIAGWSHLNRLLVVMSATLDARGYRQWQAAGRQVCKGAKAIHILIPCMTKTPKTNKDGSDVRDGAGEVVYSRRLSGFRTAPVFRVEDTEGEPLDYQLGVKQVPLAEIARSWGIKVMGMPGGNGQYGAFRLDGSQIRLATPDAEVFFHELCHAAHRRVLLERGESMQGGQNPGNEIAAEFGAMILCRLYGYRAANEGEMFQYLVHYAGGPDQVHQACFGVLKDVFAVLEEIIAAGQSLGIHAVA